MSELCRAAPRYTYLSKPPIEFLYNLCWHESDCSSLKTPTTYPTWMFIILGEIQCKHTAEHSGGCPTYYCQYRPFTAKQPLLLDSTGLSSGIFKGCSINHISLLFLSSCDSVKCSSVIHVGLTYVYHHRGRKIMEISLVMLCMISPFFHFPNERMTFEAARVELMYFPICFSVKRKACNVTLRQI